MLGLYTLEFDQAAPALPRDAVPQRGGNLVPKVQNIGFTSLNGVEFRNVSDFDVLSAHNVNHIYPGTMLPRGDTQAGQSPEMHYSTTVRAALSAGALAVVIAVSLAVANMVVPSSGVRTSGLIVFLFGTALLAIGLQQARRQLRDFEGS